MNGCWFRIRLINYFIAIDNQGEWSIIRYVHWKTLKWYSKPFGIHRFDLTRIKLWKS